ncbi:MAG TPA: helix-turn-helix domain-containing protein [Actinomycetota bacterium]|nr:helix-turn-helix domain-containing protein [Actinomycetota bacterium]
MRDPVKRAYRSPLREAQAKATRLRVVDAAARLFIEHGYGATSVDAVAEAAEVGRATVFTSVGGKAALLRTAYDVAIVGDDEPVPLPERSWAQPVREATTQSECLDRYADVIVLVGGRVAPIYEAFRGAAASDPEVRAQWDEIRSDRRVGARNVVSMLTRLGSLRSGLDAVTAADVVWIFNDPGLYHQLVLQRGWKPSKFRAWASDSMRSQLLDPESAGLP